MVTLGLMEFWPGATFGLLWAMICLASARVHLDVKAAAGSKASCVWTVGSGNPGVGAGIVVAGLSAGRFAWAAGDAMSTVAATPAAAAKAAADRRRRRGLLGVE